jgi:hypothetical protein
MDQPSFPYALPPQYDLSKVITPDVKAAANVAALQAFLTGQDAPLVGYTGPRPGDPIAYGDIHGDVFPWHTAVETILRAGFVRLYTPEDIAAFKAAKKNQQVETPSGVADHLRDIVAKAQAEIEARNAFVPTAEAAVAARTEQLTLARDRQVLLNQFRAP